MLQVRSIYTLTNKPSTARKHYVEGYKCFCKLMAKFESDQKVFVYFSGSKTHSGESWCPDCNKAEKIVQNVMINVDADAHFIHVDVGDKKTWFDQNCPFRTDSRTKLFTLPTLMRWQSHQVLNSEQCRNPDLVELLLTNTE